jgi:hypothetical protein
MHTRPFPARLHLLIARNGTSGIVIRRGPSKQVCILHWDRINNLFTVSQWLKGRIYERRCDISPSGKYWIYFAMNGRWQSEAKGSWTAIAKVPWLKAIELLPKGDCWHGGGLFINDKSYWLNDGYGHESLFTSKEITRNKSYQPQNHYGGECLNVYFNRLQRDGWNLINNREKEKWHEETIFEKKLAYDWKIQKICHAQLGSPPGKGCYWDEHQLLDRNGNILNMTKWEWADWLDNAIVFAEDGCLYKTVIENSSKLSEAQLIHDFNEYKFENRQAPY